MPSPAWPLNQLVIQQLAEGVFYLHAEHFKNEIIFQQIGSLEYGICAISGQSTLDRPPA